MTDDSRSAILDLAHSMLNRYLARADRSLAQRSGEEDASVVLVMGAAASYLSGMPSWQSLYSELLDAIEAAFKDRRAMLEELWSKLSPYIGPQPAGSDDARFTHLEQVAKVEQILGVACEIAPARRAVIEVLKKRYGGQREDLAPPQLGYELIAHLLRHGFIDHLITFNFDEVLDAALSNELGPEPDGVLRIISDSNLPLSKEERRPCYLKIHGTISAPESLRFTRERTQTLSSEMLRLLDQTVFRNGKTHLVTIGYSWSDDDFVQWVLGRWDRLQKVTIVRGKPSIPALLQERYLAPYAPAMKKEMLLKLHAMVGVISMEAVAGDLDLPYAYPDDLLWALVNGIESKLTSLSVPFVSSARHIVLGQIFRAVPPPSESQRWEVSYKNTHDPESRLRVELWLQTAKSKGMVNLSVLARTPRINRYWERYLREYKADAKRLTEFLPPTVNASSHGEVKETYFSNARNGSYLANALLGAGYFAAPSGEKIVVPKVQLEKKSRLLKKSGTIYYDFVEVRELLEQKLVEIWGGEEVEVVPTPDPRAKWLLHSPTAITSYLELRTATMTLLKRNWTDLLVIAESGSWLANGELFVALQEAQKATKSERTIRLLLAGEDGFEDWKAWQSIREDLMPIEGVPGVTVASLALPWWRHNRHLTLALEVSRGRIVLHGGIYFRRRLKDSRIAPVLVTDEHDQMELLLVFAAYCVRALEKREESDRPPSTGEETFTCGVLHFLEKATSGGFATEEQKVRTKGIRDRLRKISPSLATTPPAP